MPKKRSALVKEVITVVIIIFNATPSGSCSIQDGCTCVCEVQRVQKGKKEGVHG